MLWVSAFYQICGKAATPILALFLLQGGWEEPQRCCVRVFRMRERGGECVCVRNEHRPDGWPFYARVVLTAPRGAVDGNAVAKGVEKIRDEVR